MTVQHDVGFLFVFFLASQPPTKARMGNPFRHHPRAITAEKGFAGRLAGGEEDG